jgi:pSer/pThr/pTyr-binding forkhead associated (FHA) protein
MVRLILIFEEQVIQEFPFHEDSITMGRQNSNSIVIKHFAVSRFHARIDKSGSDFIIKDLKSTNGTIVNGNKVVAHTLSHGDTIGIGKHVIRFVDSEEDWVESEEADEMEMTRSWTMDEIHGARTPEKTGVLSSIDGSHWGEIELTKKLTKLGRAGTSDIRLSGLFMGATVASISQRPSGYSITFGGGLRRLRVNGRIVKESVPLNEFDTIKVGSYKFQFYEKEVNR